ncbi:FtsX-like permease family protein [Paenibacillus sp. GYB004]|uniref:ABC transporter permease n=1 Tax=Paenibacillus sp. GYB004 TaxID=2994393 RepID=UPI002F960BC0
MLALLLMMVRKLANNGWLAVCLLGGLVMSVALVSSIPIYTDAVLQRMLIKDLEQFQITSGRYPGIHYAKAVMGGTSYWDTGDYKPEDRPQAVRTLDDFMRKEAAPGFGLPVSELVRERRTTYYSVTPAEQTRIESGTNRQIELAARSGLSEHIRLADGRLPADRPVDGIYEALVTEQSLKALNMVLGNVFVINDEEAKTNIRITPVGVVAKKDNADPYWYNQFEDYAKTFFIDFELYERDFTTGEVLPTASAGWLFLLDYSRMGLDSMHRFVEASERIESFLSGRFRTYLTEVPAMPTLQTYFQREADLRKMLWSLYVPIMIMLAYYLYMVSNLITERQQTEIAVLRSRGASRLQVAAGYMIEGLLLGAVALAIGPPLGMLLVRLLGASNGFLEFVNRSALPVRLSGESYRYALYAVAASVLMTLFPALAAARLSIVSHTRQLARRGSRSLWHRFYIDFVLVAAAVFGLRRFDRQRSDWMRMGADGSDFSVDPLLFFFPAMFILGAGLLMLRFYPWLLRLLYWTGRKRWPPALYATLIQVGRAGAPYLYVMMFLIMTIAIGLYSASAARTLNDNAEHKIRYKNGADIVLKQAWISDAPLSGSAGPTGRLPGNPGEQTSADAIRADTGSAKRTHYVEPPFQPFLELPGVQSAAKVFVKEEAGYAAGKEGGPIRLMGINTAEFGRTAWLRNGLLEHHLNDYLNLIATDPSAVLISRTMADQGIKPGDVIYIDWSGVPAKPFTVYGVVNYWPAMNPNPSGRVRDGVPPEIPRFVIGHLEYIQLALAPEPYEVWIRFKDGESRQPLYDALAANGISLISVADTREEVVAAKNDPFQLAVNGVMTLGFLIAVIISFAGFLLHGVLSLSGRLVQFGILRAMGISFPQLLGMLAAEQLLTTAAAVVMGGLVGGVTSAWFVALFEISFSPSTQVPPFQVTFDSGDTLKLYVIVTGMITAGLVVLGWLLSRIRIHQAVKLGED